MKIEDSFFDDYFQKHHLLLEPSKICNLSWGDVIENLNLCVLNQSQIKVSEKFGIVLHDTYSENLRDIVRFAYNLSVLFEVPTSTHYYISMSEKSKTFGKHKDNACVFLYQAIGQTEITIWDTEIVTYVMKPNDIIYIPRGMYHSTNPLKPRVNLSFGLDYEN